ncbi:MAG TPA: hypothetical protein VGB54_05595 [Allosphingosinicella sp.]|jgi:hypothetical protein
MESDIRYYTRRAAEENLRARKAVTNAARERHLELAGMFSLKAEQRSIERVHAAA